MKNRTKAVLLSALVFPGTGHWFLKRYVTAVLLFSVSSISVYFLFSIAIESSREISEQILQGTIQPDLANITAAISKQSVSRDTPIFSAATMIIVICWIAGIADSYRTGTSLKNK